MSNEGRQQLPATVNNRGASAEPGFIQRVCIVFGNREKVGCDDEGIEVIVACKLPIEEEERSSIDMVLQ